MKKNRIFIFFIICTLSIACVKDFNLQVDTEQERILVIDGSIHDSFGPYYVTLSYTYSFDEENAEIISDGKVWVEDDLGMVYTYFNSGDTIFQSPQELRAEAGKTYTLNVEVNGNLYKSDAQLLLASPNIDSVYIKYSVQPSSTSNELKEGAQVFVDSEASEDERIKYFRFEYNDAYIIVPPYAANRVLDENGEIVVLRDTVLHPCYVTNESQELLIETSINSTIDYVKEYPLRFLPADQPQLRTRYGIKLRQYAITKEAYFFYKQLIENNKSGGSLFDKQVGSVFGNLTNVTNPDEPVLGFFEVSGLQEEVTFFTYDELPLPYPRPSYNFSCAIPRYIPVDSLPFYFSSSEFQVFVFDVFGSPPIAGITSSQCGRCNTFADVVVPDFWFE